MKAGYCAFNKTNQCFLGLKVSAAFTPLARIRGLLGRLRMGQDEGLWLAPSRGIHTVGMLFPIDVVFLDKCNCVIHLIEHLRPFRLSPIRIDAASILELPVHTIYATQTSVGDQLLICRPDELGTDPAERFACANAGFEAEEPVHEPA